MRAELVVAALARQPNRYALVRTAAKAARMLHRPKTRIPDTINDAFLFLALPRKKAPARQILREQLSRSNAA